jgi:hypothetical protein
VIRENYGNVADFVVAHQDQPEVSHLVGRLEGIVFPKGRHSGPLFSHQRNAPQWEEMRQLAGRIEASGLPVECVGAASVVYLAQSLLAEHDKVR